MEDEPEYECEEDLDCLCTEGGIEGEWECDADQSLWVCTCGSVQ